MASKSALDAQRGNIFYIAPERLTLVTDKDHPLYDPRVEDEPEERFIENIKLEGVLNAIHVRKDGDAIVVVLGRGRTKAALEANRRLAAERQPTMLVPVVVKKGNDAALFGSMISENEIRRDDTMLVKGGKARKLLNMGYQIPQIAVTFGVTRQAVESWLAVDELPEVIKKDVEIGALSATAAIQLAKYPREEQVKRFEDLKRQGAKKTVATVRSAAASKDNKPAPKIKSRKEIEKLLNGNIPAPTNLIGYSEGFREALRWVLGQEGGAE